MAVSSSRRDIFYILLALASVSLVLLVRHTVSSAELDRISLNEAQRSIPNSLFLELDQLARVVDVSYCVGNTGLRKPFECLSHCADLEGFELISVGASSLMRRRSWPISKSAHPDRYGIQDLYCRTPAVISPFLIRRHQRGSSSLFVAPIRSQTP